MTQVKELREDNWGIKHLLKYLRGTRKFSLALTIDNIGIIKLYIDAAFVLHPSYPGYTGVAIFLGKGEKVDYPTNKKLMLKVFLSVKWLETTMGSLVPYIFIILSKLKSIIWLNV